MSAKTTIANSLFSDLGAFFKRLARVGHELLTGEVVVKETWHAQSGIVEKTFQNGLRIVEKPGAAPVASVPERWLAGKDGLVTQLREGSFTVKESWSAKSGVVEKTFQNGVKVVQKPGVAPVVTLPNRLLTKGAIRL